MKSFDIPRQSDCLSARSILCKWRCESCVKTFVEGNLLGGDALAKHVVEGGTATDRYPLWIVVLSSCSIAVVWVFGSYLIWATLGVVAAIAFIAYLLALEVNLLRRSCVDCYYYGKVCFSGRGKVCACVFKKGDPARFSSREISWKDVLPDLAASFVPIICGAGLLVVDFSWVVMAMVITLLALSTAGNALMRGRLACRHCHQKAIGCPAERLFAGDTRQMSR